MIIDASVGVKWLIPEHDRDAAVALLRRPDLRVPMLFFSEVGNALLKKARKGEIDLAGIASAFSSLPDLVTPIDELEAMPRALALAAELGHGIYDCVYLALAEKTDEQLVTADRKFTSKLSGQGVGSRVMLLGSSHD